MQQFPNKISANVIMTLNLASISGPVPIFFSDKPEDTLEDLKKSPEWAFHYLQALVSRLLVRSQLTR